MKTVIIYDNSGYIYFTMSDTYQLPQGGIQYIETEIPEGKIATKVDTTVTPNVAILEDAPLGETQLLQQQVDSLNIAIANILGV